MALAHVESDTTAWQQWQTIIDQKLSAWIAKAGEFEDDGIDPPSEVTISLAIRLAKKLQSEGAAAPDNVVRDANGGIVLERRINNGADVYHVWDDGNIEHQTFAGNRLVSR